MGSKVSSKVQGRLSAVIRQDPKRGVLLAALSLVLLVMAGRLLMKGRSVPSRASAVPLMDASGLPTGQVQTRARVRSGDVGDSLQRWIESDIPLVIGRNVFAVKLEYFPLDGTRQKEVKRGSDEESFWDQLAKSVSEEADQQQRRQNLVANLRQQAGQLKLQSIVMGANPKALIDGELVREGEVVASFRVLKIEARRVIVEREGIKLEIQMK